MNTVEKYKVGQKVTGVGVSSGKTYKGKYVRPLVGQEHIHLIICDGVKKWVNIISKKEGL